MVSGAGRHLSGKEMLGEHASPASKRGDYQADNF